MQLTLCIPKCELVPPTVMRGMRNLSIHRAAYAGAVLPLPSRSGNANARKKKKKKEKSLENVEFCLHPVSASCPSRCAGTVQRRVISTTLSIDAAAAI